METKIKEGEEFTQNGYKLTAYQVRAGRFMLFRKAGEFDCYNRWMENPNSPDELFGTHEDLAAVGIYPVGYKAPPKLGFATGKTYKARGGWTAKIEANDGTDRPFLVNHEAHPNGIKRGGMLWHFLDGRCNTGEGKYDLVEEVKTPAEPAQFIKFAKGDKVVSKTGKKGVVEDCTPETIGRPAPHTPYGIRWEDGIYTATHSDGTSWNPNYDKPDYTVDKKVDEKFVVCLDPHGWKQLTKGKVYKVVGEGISAYKLEGVKCPYDDEPFWSKDKFRPATAEDLAPPAPQIDLLTANRGDKFKTRDGQTVVFAGRNMGEFNPERFPYALEPLTGRIDGLRTLVYKVDGIYGFGRTHRLDLVEKVEEEKLPIGTWIKFKRNSRSGRYLKDQVALVVDHGTKSLVCKIDGDDINDAIFLPPNRDDIYTVTTAPKMLKDLKHGEPVVWAKSGWIQAGNPIRTGGRADLDGRIAVTYDDGFTAKVQGTWPVR